VTSPDPTQLPTVAPVPDVLEDLEWRGLLAQTTDRAALAADLAAGPVTLYAGFDPTADSLHVGSLVPLLALRRFQLAGHRPIALAGGATGFIGDPSGRSSERTLMSADVIEARVKLLRAQMSRFLDFGDGPTDAVMADNIEWTAPLSVLDFLRDVGKHFPVNQMLARESVAGRLESGGLSFTEFTYQLLQSLDFLELHRRYGCTLQVGGNDQWGNITAGLDYMRRVDQAHGHALTFPLVTDSAGQKLGKSTGGGNVWIDPAMTSPYALWQFLLNVDDRDAGTYLRLLTFVGREEVEALDALTRDQPAAPTAPTRYAGCAPPRPRCSAVATCASWTRPRSRPRWRRPPPCASRATGRWSSTCSPRAWRCPSPRCAGRSARGARTSTTPRWPTRRRCPERGTGCTAATSCCARASVPSSSPTGARHPRSEAVRPVRHAVGGRDARRGSVRLTPAPRVS